MVAVVGSVVVCYAGALYIFQLIVHIYVVITQQKHVVQIKPMAACVALLRTLTVVLLIQVHHCGSCSVVVLLLLFVVVLFLLLLMSCGVVVLYH